MNDKFLPISARQLLQMILNEYDRNKSIFGIPEELFYHKSEKLISKLFNQTINNPVGVAAGPHTQMSQNIIAAWLMGARYIELKTIQTLDNLEISKPCIDMQDEGYNCEWSQELSIKESFNEYLKAWVIIHILNHKLFKNQAIDTIFNMSIGYNLEGILKPNVQWFLEKMNDSEPEIIQTKDSLRVLYPLIDDILIPKQLSNNITLSTMHGCPPDEINDIAAYLLNEKRLHTFIKLNPTLLGQEAKEILNKDNAFKAQIPDIAFEHDLKYPDAIEIIKNLKAIAVKNKLEFGIKLTNTLEVINNKDIFDRSIEMMYMSGRALHPISIRLAEKISNAFKGELEMSFSGGIDAFNITEVLSCGIKTITVCSDLLKPGGYMRLKQYFDNIHKEFLTLGAQNIEEFIVKKGNQNEINEAKKRNYQTYIKKIAKDNRYKRQYFSTPDIKSGRALSYFDCIAAPCQEECATNQNVPEYMFQVSNNSLELGLMSILSKNPFPSVTGMICDHLCQNKCTRINYDNSLQIREIKRYIAENSTISLHQENKKSNKKAAIIGAGPSGLACAYYLAIKGMEVDVYDEKSKTGGMVRYAIPGFRLTDNAIDKDIQRIIDLGVRIHYNSRVIREEFEALRKQFDYIYIATGAQKSAKLKIENIDKSNVLDPLDLLFKIKSGESINIGNKIVIIGGGNTAMDIARTLYRVSNNNTSIKIVYRRTIPEMPADKGEIKAVLEEGIDIIELTIARKIISENGKIKALQCNKAIKSEESNRKAPPELIPNSEYEIPCDTIIAAIGQSIDIDFIPNELLQSNDITYKTKLKNIYIGGDALRGAATAIKAIADGRKVAESIINDWEDDVKQSKPFPKRHSKRELILKKSKREYGIEVHELPINERKSFKMISTTFNAEEAKNEAQRCLYCDELCNICVSVCPNLANYSYEIVPQRIALQKAVKNEEGQIELYEDEVFEIKQPYQILNIANFCNECGNCGTFCPTKSAPYKEKPKFYLTIESFNKAEEGYFISKHADKTVIIYKHQSQIATLSELEECFYYETSHVTAKFDKSTFRIKEINILTPCAAKVRFKDAAEMRFLLEGASPLF